MMSPEKIKNTISENLSCEFIEIKGDDGTHFEAIIVSKEFENISNLTHISIEEFKKIFDFS